jgi:hypothetical protein
MGFFLSFFIFTGFVSAYTNEAANYIGPSASSYGSAKLDGYGVKLPGGETLKDYVKAYTYDSSYGEGHNVYPQDMDYSNRYFYNLVPLEEEMSFEKLVELVETKNLRTIEDVLSQLPKHMLDLNYVVMYRSRSLQEASPQSPRIITYTPTARFVLTFNGGEPQRFGSQTLELMQYREAEQRFEFREIVFNGKSNPVVSGANPAKCLECHQSPSRTDIDPRPNWEPYSTWIGAFGSNNGMLKTISLAEEFKSRLRPTDSDAMVEQAGEFELFKKYINEIAPSHPRYKYLQRFNFKASNALTEHLGILNFSRIARLMMANTEIFDQYKEFLASRLYCYGSEHAEYPVVKWHYAFNYPQYFDFETTYTPFTTVQSLITQLFEPLGVDTSDWSTDFGNGGLFAFSGRFGLPSVSRDVFRSTLRRMNSSFAELSKTSCEDLKAMAEIKLTRSFEEGFQEKTRGSNLRPPANGAQIFQRCISCHVTDTQSWIPKLPFGDVKTLAKKLGEPFSRRGTLLDEITYRTSDMATSAEQMPRRGRLSSDERIALIDYLRSLSTN